MDYIFIHGLGQTKENWDGILLKFKRGKAHCPNLQSLLTTPDVTYENLYASFKAYCDGFSEPLNLCGLSLGGILALSYTIEHPDRVNSLVLIGTPYKIPKALFKLQNFVFRRMPTSFFGSMGFTKNGFISLTTSMAKLDFSSRLADISCSTLVVCGMNDTVNKKGSIELSNLVKQSKLAFIPNSKHEVNTDNPDGLLLELEQFYDTIL